MNKIICPITTFFVLASVAIAQNPLSVEVSIVDVTAKTETVKRTTLTFGEATLPAGESVTSTTESKRSAALVTTSEPADVQAFSSDLELASVADAGNNRYLVTGKPGRYMLVIDTGERNKLVPVVIPGPDGGSDPPGDRPPPSSELESLVESSATLADRVDDAPTRSELAKALKPELPDDFTQAKMEVGQRISDVMLARGRESRDKDWINGWRRPLDKEMKRLDVDTIEEYKPAIEFIRQGLEQTGAQSVLKVEVPKTEPAPATPSKSVVLPMQAFFAKPRTRIIPLQIPRCTNGQCWTETIFVEVPY